MSELPVPVPRRPVHTRRLAFEGFLRDDGLWDLDCELSDTKAMAIEMRERGRLEPGDPVHLLRVRLTIDDQFTIHDVQTGVQAVPFGECHRAADAPMRKLVGLTMGPGWRKTIEGAIGGVAGCTHLRELVFNAATAAFQMIPHYRELERGRSPNPPGATGDKPPFYLGQCMTWSFEGPVVQRLMPRFYRGPVTKDE
ncbi:MAG: DUF2889 domain-containing protein [Ramlibacter sp.]